MTTRRDFDPLGRLVRESQLGHLGAEVRRELEYGASGLLWHETRPHLVGDTTQGVITYAHFGPGRRLNHVLLPNGTEWKYAYATSKTLSSSLDSWRSGADDAHFVKVTAPDGSIRGMGVDVFGALTASTDELGGRTVYRYGAFNDLLEVEDSRGNMTSFDRNTLGRVLTATDPDMGIQSYTYNPFGEVTDHQDATGRVRHFEYDRAGRLETITDPGDVISAAAVSTGGGLRRRARSRRRGGRGP